MNGEHGPVVVGIDGSEGSDAALEWAVDEARSLERGLHLLTAYGDEYVYGAIATYGRGPLPEPPGLQAAAGVLLDAATARARELEPRLEVSTAVSGERAVRALLDESERAPLLVLGSRGLKGFGSAVLGSVSSAVVARAGCPVVVVRGPAAPLAERPEVVVGVDASGQAEPVLGFAFDHASRRGLALRAVLCRHRDRLFELAQSAQREGVAPHAEVWLSEALAGWRERFPDVTVHPQVVRDQPVAGLVAAAAGQHLLVVGARGDHARFGAMLGSVSQGVLHHASCPVAVVPVVAGSRDTG